jgi:PIN like domain
VPATPQVARWFVDENSLGVAKALAYVRGDITWPGAPDGPVSAGAADTNWLPIIGRAGLIVLTRDKRIRSRPLERQALLDHNVRACFLTNAAASHVRIFDNDNRPTSLTVHRLRRCRSHDLVLWATPCWGRGATNLCSPLGHRSW